MDVLLIAVEKRGNAGFTAKVGVTGQERNELLVVQLDAATGIDFEEGLIDFLLVDALEVEAQLPYVCLLHNPYVFSYSVYARPVLRGQR